MQKWKLLAFVFLTVVLVVSSFSVLNFVPNVKANPTPTLWEHYNTDDDDYYELFPSGGAYGYWGAQTFTVGAIAHTVASIKLKMYKGGNPGTLTVSIKATDESSHPTGSDLTVGTINASTFTTSPAWYEIAVTEYTLSVNTKYAVVCRALDGDMNNYVGWKNDMSYPTYDDGCFEWISNIITGTWASNPNIDFMFEVWGNPVPMLLTFNSKYVVASTTAVTTTSATLVDDTEAFQAFGLATSKVVLVIYQANNVKGATMPKAGMQNAISVDGVDQANSWDSNYGANEATRNCVFWVGTLNSTVGAEPILFENSGNYNYTKGYNIINGADWVSQSFTPSTTHTLGFANFSLCANSANEIGTVTVELQEAVGDVPQMVTLDSSTLNINTISISWGWVTFDFSGSYSLIAENHYAFVMHSTNTTLWCDGESYAGGSYAYSSNSGSNWNVDETADMSFAEYGTIPHTIKGMFASNSGATATVSNRVLLIYIFDGNEFQYVDDATTATTATTTFIDDPNAQVTFTPSAACKALLLYNVANSGATESGYGKKVAINVGGTDYGQAEKSPDDSNYADSVFTCHALSLSATSTTVKGRFANAGDAATVTIHRRQLAVLLLDDSTLFDIITSTTRVSTTSNSLVNDTEATISRTTTDNRELLVVAMGTKRSGTDGGGYGEHYGIKINANDRANSRGSPYNSASADSAATAYAEHLAAGSQTVQGRFSNNGAGDNSTIDARQVVALWFDVGHALNLKIVDYDLTDAIADANVYVQNDTGSYVKISDNNGWANWTGMSGTVYVNVSYYGFWVNGTFSVTMDYIDTTINVQCNLYDVNVKVLADSHSVLLGANMTAYSTTSPTLYEHYNTGDDEDYYYEPFAAEKWVAQTFTVGATLHTISSVKLKMFRTENPGTLIVSIRATDENGHPTGSDLTVGTIDANTFTNDSTGAWYEIFLTEYILPVNTKYAIVARATGSFSTAVNWRFGTEGTWDVSDDSGSSWHTIAFPESGMFEVWGTPLSSVRTALTESPNGIARLVNLPNNTLTFIVYDGVGNILASTTITITHDEQSETITITQNYSEVKIPTVYILDKEH